MSDFFLNNYSILTRAVEFSAAISGLYFLKKYQNTSAKYFIWFLVYIALIEVIGSYALYIGKFRFFDFLINTKFKTSHWCATVFWNIGSALFFSFYYSKILKNKINISIIKIVCITFLAASIVSIAINWETFFNQFSPFITVFGALVILMCIAFHLIEILRDERIIMFYESINFVISATLLIWLIITTPLVLYNAYYSSADWNFVFLKWQIFLFANIFMYLTFTFALIFCKPTYDKKIIPFINSR